MFNLVNQIYLVPLQKVESQQKTSWRGEKKVQQGNTKLFLFWHALVRQLVKCVTTSMHIKDYFIKTTSLVHVYPLADIKKKSQLVSFSLIFNILDTRCSGIAMFGVQRCDLWAF